MFSGAFWNGYEIDIAGDLTVTDSPHSMLHFQSLARAAPLFSDDRIRAGGLIVNLEGFKLEFIGEQGSLLVNSSALRFAHISEANGHIFGAGSLKSLSLHHDKANVHTLESEFPVIMFAFRR